jgi:hypothetical protein
MKQLTIVLAAGLSFVVGTASGIFLLPIWVRPVLAAIQDGKPADWIGFAGAIVGAIGVLIGAALAFWAVQRQIAAASALEEEKVRRERASLQVRQAETKEAALVVMSQPVHAATAALFGIRRYLKSTSSNDMIKWSRATVQAMAQLEQALNHFSLRELAGDLEINDRLHYVMVLSRLSTIVTLFSKRPGILNAQQTFMMLRAHLESIPDLLRPFDDELASVFERDSAA